MKFKRVFLCCVPNIKNSSSLSLSYTQPKILKSISEVMQEDSMSITTQFSGRFTPESECSITLFQKDSSSDFDTFDDSDPPSRSTMYSESVGSDQSATHPFAARSNEAICGSVTRLQRDREKTRKDLCVTGKSISPKVVENSSRKTTQADGDDCGYSFTPFEPDYGKPRFGKTDLTNTDSGEDLLSYSSQSDSSSNLSVFSTEVVAIKKLSDNSFVETGVSLKSSEDDIPTTPSNMKCPAASVQGHSLMAGDVIIMDLDDTDDLEVPEKKESPISQKSQDLVTIVRGSMKPISRFPFRRAKPLEAWSDQGSTAGSQETKPTQCSESSLVKRFRGAFSKRRGDRPKGAKQRDVTFVTSLHAHSRK